MGPVIKDKSTVEGSMLPTLKQFSIASYKFLAKYNALSNIARCKINSGANKLVQTTLEFGIFDRDSGFINNQVDHYNIKCSNHTLLFIMKKKTRINITVLINLIDAHSTSFLEWRNSING